MRFIHVLGCLSVIATGCVSAGKYEELNKKYDRARAQLADRHVKVRTLEQALAEQQANALQLESQIDENRAWIATLEAELEKSGKLVSDRAKLQETADQLKQALAVLAQRKQEAEKRVAEYRDMLVRFKDLIDAGTLSVRVVDGRMVLALPTDVLFDSGSARLSKIGKATVQQVGAVLTGMNRRRVQVEGHTDNVPIHNDQFPSNWELASARALVVVRSMMNAGMPSDALSAASYGEFHPAATNDDPAGRAVNRRIEVVLLPDLSTLPGFDELQHAVSLQ
jgi:chemotaxis protein MotB